MPTTPVQSAAPSTLIAKQISKTYGKRPILQGVDLSLTEGEAVGLLGPNGAGKTTCFSILTGLVKPDLGKIYLNGDDITHTPLYFRARSGIGYLPQDASIFRGMTVEENILAALELYEKDYDKRQTFLNLLLDEFSISHLRGSPAIALSGGERRRVEIARALATRPHFLLLDEPLAGIDPIAVGEIREVILHLKSLGIGILITDHNVRETLDIVDRAYIIAGGQVLCEGTPEEIISNENVRRVYLGERFSL
ncbi:MAG: LPS export ABC transporter ATP-binding protein [Pseudomonadota bacterium]|jgi:lipopolysaccharide export system ATP-binding protein|nr:LPS export ABC transporter ATP-binding protein [Alphaproteobacteria bacterium]MDP5370353.1 LPS export ABC transporter ATP-binding protein [Pseudomonadota bacterium]